MIFVIFNAATHILTAVAYWTSVPYNVLVCFHFLRFLFITQVYIYLVLYVFAELVKMADLETLSKEFKGKEENPNLMKILYGLTSFYIFCYVLEIVLQIVIDVLAFEHTVNLTNG